MLQPSLIFTDLPANLLWVAAREIWVVDSVPAHRKKRIVSQFLHLFDRHPITLIRENAGGYEFFESGELSIDSGIHGIRVGLKPENAPSKFLDSLFPLRTM
jgi:hypothetical protein